MKKPIFRWTIGSKVITSYEVLEASIKSVLKLFGETFDYYVLYNKNLPWVINRLKKSYKNITFLEQKYYDFPHLFSITSKNGSLWKICPARLNIDVHEIICDNDLIFLKKPEAILEFLNSNKNFIAEDTNPYMGIFQQKFSPGECYNSGLIGLPPGYDFSSEISKEAKKAIKKSPLLFNGYYDDEQGLLSYCLTKDKNCIIGKSHDFVGIHSQKISLNAFREEVLKKHSLKFLKNSFTDVSPEILKDVIHQASTIHFLEINRVDNHYAWNYFKYMLNYTV